VRAALARLLADDSGQDLVEYALLAATIGLACAAGFQTMLALIGTAYRRWTTNIDALCEPPLPGG
jgi:Flp pilus assembly pilin Flp